MKNHHRVLLFFSRFMPILSLIVVLAMVMVGCSLMPKGMGAKSVEPHSTGGVMLRGTNDVKEGDSISISPNGQWLLYYSDSGTPFQPVYVLYDLQKEERFTVGLSPKVRDYALAGNGPLGRGCWNVNSSAAFLTGIDNTIAFNLDVDIPAPQWQMVTDIDNKIYQNVDCLIYNIDATDIVDIKYNSSKEVTLVDRQYPSRILAHHMAGLAIDRIVVSELTLSPNKSILGYVIDQYRGNFVSPSQGYVLRLGSNNLSKPLLLAAPIYGLFSFDSSDYVYAMAGGPNGSKGIYRWEIQDDI